MSQEQNKPGKWSIFTRDSVHNSPDPHIPGIIRWIVLVCVLIWSWSFMSKSTVKRVTIETGQEGVMMDKPWTTLGHQGLRDETLQPGTHWVLASTDIIPVAMTPQRFDVTFDDLPTANNNLLDYQTYLVLQVTNSQQLIKRYPVKWYEFSIEKQYGNIVRKVVSTKSFDDIMTKPETNVDIEKQVRAQLLEYLEDTKLPIAIVDMSLGKAKPQPDVLLEMNKTASEAQRFKTLVQTANAETQRAISERKRAEADNAYRQALGMSTNEVKDLQIAKIYADACKENKNCILNLGGAGLLAPPGR